MGSGEKEWKAFNNRWESQERVNELQRAERIKANQILWSSKSNSESANEDIGDEVSAAEPAVTHHINPTIPTEEKALKPNTDKFTTDPLEITTSKVEIILPKKTGMARETAVVVTDGLGVEGYSVAKVSLSCEFKTAMMKRRKARRYLTTHNRSDHQQNTVASNGMAYVQKLVKIAPTSTKLSLQCEVLNCTFRTPLLRKSKAR